MQDLWGQRERSAEGTCLCGPILIEAGGPCAELCPWCYWCNLSSNYFGINTLFPSLRQRFTSMHRNAWIQRRPVSSGFCLSLSISLFSWSPTCFYSAVYSACVKNHFQTFQLQVKYWLLRQFTLLTIKAQQNQGTSSWRLWKHQVWASPLGPYWEVPFSCSIQIIAVGIPWSGKTQALHSVHQGPKSVTGPWYKSFNIDNVCLGIGKSTMFFTEIRTNLFNCSCEKMLNFVI